MSSKFERLKNYYQSGFWTKEMLHNAVEKNWITAEEYKSIVGEDY